MGMKKYKLFLVLMMVLPILTWAHEDFYFTHKVNETSLRIRTGFNFEEISKARLVCDLVDDLRGLHDYCKAIHIDYIHDYVGYSEKIQFLNIGRPKVLEKYESRISDIDNKDGIILRIIDEEFPISDVLKIIEYAIGNEEKVRELQRQYDYKSRFINWTLYSVAQELIADIKKGGLSSKGAVVNSIPRYKINEDDFRGYTYFLKNAKYHICYRQRERYDEPVEILNNLFQIANLSDYNAVVFDTKKTFRYYSKRGRKLYRRHKIVLGEQSSQPYKLLETGSDKIVIRYPVYTGRQRDYLPGREVLYLIDTDSLIDDFDAFIRSK